MFEDSAASEFDSRKMSSEEEDSISSCPYYKYGDDDHPDLIDQYCESGEVTMKKIAETALRYYNHKHGTNYEYVEGGFRSNGLFLEDIWNHVNFKAKDNSVSGSQVKLFFAESKIIPHPTRYEPSCCRILDGVKQVDHCYYCDVNENIVHPAYGFKHGLYGLNLDRIYSLRPRPPKKFKK